MFTWRKEDPSTTKILEGGTTFRRVYMEEFRSVRLPRREAAGIKDDGRQKQKYNLDPSALFTDVKNYLSAEYLSQLSTRGDTKRNVRPLPAVITLWTTRCYFCLVCP